MEKMTYVSCINDVLNGVALTADHKEKLKAMIKHFEKGNAKPNKTQIANQNIANRIVECMVSGHKYTVSDCIKTFDFLVDENGKAFTPQKVSPMLHSLCSNGILYSITEKGRSYFYKGELPTEE